MARLHYAASQPAGRRQSLSGGFFKLAIGRFLSRAPPLLPARAIFSILKQLYIRAANSAETRDSAEDGLRWRVAIEPASRAAGACAGN